MLWFDPFTNSLIGSRFSHLFLACTSENNRPSENYFDVVIIDLKCHKPIIAICVVILIYWNIGPKQPITGSFLLITEQVKHC